MAALVEEGLLDEVPEQAVKEPVPQQSYKCTLVPLFIFAIWVPKLILSVVGLCFAVAIILSPSVRSVRRIRPLPKKIDGSDLI